LALFPVITPFSNNVFRISSGDVKRGCDVIVIMGDSPELIHFRDTIVSLNKMPF